MKTMEKILSSVKEMATALYIQTRWAYQRVATLDERILFMEPFIQKDASLEKRQAAIKIQKRKKNDLKQNVLIVR